MSVYLFSMAQVQFSKRHKCKHCKNGLRQVNLAPSGSLWYFYPAPSPPPPEKNKNIRHKLRLWKGHLLDSCCSRLHSIWQVHLIKWLLSVYLGLHSKKQTRKKNNIYFCRMCCVNNFHWINRCHLEFILLIPASSCHELSLSHENSTSAVTTFKSYADQHHTLPSGKKIELN